jgi:nucleoside-diphosphate-sugar epimerase
MKIRDVESVLVTGARSFIRQHLVRRLFERGDRVSCLVRATSRLDATRSAGVQLIAGEVTDGGDLESALAASQADVVFHLAGLVKALRTEDFLRVNAGGAEALAGSWTCSSAKVRKQLGWSPAATLAERLRETAQWYRQAGWL